MRLFDDHLYSDQRSLIYSVAFSPDGSRLISGSRDGTVIVRDDAGGSQLLFEPGPKPSAVHAIAGLPDDSLVVAHERGWDRYRLAAGAWQLFGPASTVPNTSLAVLDSHTLTIGAGDRIHPSPGVFELFDLQSERRLEPTFREPNGVRAVAACPGKQLVAWATGHKETSKRELKVWDVRRQTPLRFTRAYVCSAIALAPDGSAFAAAEEWTVFLYDLSLKQERAVLKGHKGVVSSVAFSPDGSTIVTGSWDESVKFWDAATGRERASFRWPIGKVFSLAYAPDGLRLAAGGDSGRVVVWDVD